MKNVVINFFRTPIRWSLPLYSTASQQKSFSPFFFFTFFILSKLHVLTFLQSYFLSLKSYDVKLPCLKTFQLYPSIQSLC